MKPFLSIILPVFNGTRYLPEALASIHVQTFRDWELVAIDDGSTDGSVEMLRQAVSAYGGRIRYLEHPDHANRGTLATRVLGARSARSELLALLDQDDVWEDDYLEHHIALWNDAGNSRVGLSYGPSIYWTPEDTNADFVQPMPEGTPKVFLPGELLQSFLSTDFRNTPCPSCTLIRREALLQAERFGSAARTSPCEDQYLWWSVALRWPVSIHSNPWVRYRQHAESALVTLSASTAHAVRAELGFLELIEGDISEVCGDNPVLADIRRRIEFYRAL